MPGQKRELHRVERGRTMAINVKRLLANALISLSEEKSLSKITVAEIVERAGTGRQTFYNHFRDKNDLVYWIFLCTLAGERKLVNTKGYFAYLVKLHQEAQKLSRFLCQACKLPGQNSLSDAIYQQNYDYYKKLIISQAGPEVLTDELEFALHFNAAGASHAYIRWVMNGTPGSAEEQAQRLIACMPACMLKYVPLYIHPSEADTPA